MKEKKDIEVDCCSAVASDGESKPIKKRKRPKIFNLSAISIIACDCLQSIISIFINLFFTSKVLKSGVGDGGEGISTNIIKIGIFFVLEYAVLSLSYFFSGHVLKRIKKSIFVSIGSVLLAVVVLMIYLLGDKVTSFTYIPIVGVVLGVAWGFFSSGYYNLTAETISSKHQVRFFAVKRIMLQVCSIAFPIAIGFIADIPDVGFEIATFVMFGISALLIFFSFLIKPKTSYELSFNLKQFWKYMWKNRKDTKPLWLVYVANFFRGSYDCFTKLITILVMITLGSNGILGTLQSVFTACSLITLFFYLKFYRKKRAPKFIIPTIVLVACSIVGVLVATNSVTIIIFYAVYTILNVILMSISDSRRSGVVRVLSLHSHIMESHATGEFFTGAGRVLTTVCLLLAGVFDNLVGTGSTIFLKITIAIVCATYVMFGVSLMWLEKSLVKQDEEFLKVHANEVIEKTED